MAMMTPSKLLRLMLYLFIGLMIFEVSYSLMGQGPGEEDTGPTGNVNDPPKSPGPNPAPGGDEAECPLGPVGVVNELFYAIAEPDLDALEQLLEGGSDPNQTIEFDNTSGTTPLNWAIVGSRISEIEHSQVSLLLQHGANLNLADGFGNTALHHAAQNSDDAMAAVLINAGADISLVNNAGYTALRTGSVERQYRCVHYNFKNPFAPES